MRRRVNLKSRLVMFVFLLVMAGTTFAGQTIYVDADANGLNNGSSWTDAYNYLQNALGAAASGDQIRVAEGTYKTDRSSAYPNGSGNLDAAFWLINGVSIKGGYAGYGEPNPDARDIELYETILSGDLNGDDSNVIHTNEPTRAENSLNVVIAYNNDPTATLDGFTVTGGNFTGVIIDFTFASPGGGGIRNTSGNPTLINCTFSSNSADYGGGMLNSNGSPTLTNCTFSNNFAFWDGGGMHNEYESNPTLINCTFSSNSTRNGGGMYNIEDSSPTLTNCTFSRNSAGGGGGMYNYNSNPTLTNCTFSENTASDAGAMSNYNSSPTLTNCTFSNNTAYSCGGGVCNRKSNPTLTNCTFSGNSADWIGGAMFNYHSNVTLTNCILWGDTPEEIRSDGALVVTYSDVQGSWPGEGNIDTDPCFADPCNGDYHLKSEAGRWDPCSQTWVQDSVTSPCIDAGNPGCPLGSEPNEPNNIRINMGAYGGTAEASKSPEGWAILADLTNDYIVDINDLEVFVRYWLEAGRCIPSDLNRNQFVDFSDFAIFADQRRLNPANRPPIADAGPDITVYADGYGASCCVCLDIREVAHVVMDGSNSYDPDGDTLTYIWQAPIPWLLSGIGCYDNVVEAANPEGCFPVGPTTVTLTVSDGELTDTDSLVVTVLPLPTCSDNSECGPGFYCAKAAGDCDGVGTCRPRPDACIALYDPVCGCDGQTYSNDCVAAAFGVNVAYYGECGGY